jgi:hypothetical protein
MKNKILPINTLIKNTKHPEWWIFRILTNKVTDWYEIRWESWERVLFFNEFEKEWNIEKLIVA